MGGHGIRGSLPGESLLSIVDGSNKKKDYVFAEYHDTYSATGSYMVRQGDMKLMWYAPVQEGDKPFPPQLFNVVNDPFELNDISEQHHKAVNELLELLEKEIDWKQADREKKLYDKYMYTEYFYKPKGGASNCASSLVELFGSKVKPENIDQCADWLGLPCEQLEGLDDTENNVTTSLIHDDDSAEFVWK